MFVIAIGLSKRVRVQDGELERRPKFGFASAQSGAKSAAP